MYNKKLLYFAQRDVKLLSLTTQASYSTLGT